MANFDIAGAKDAGYSELEIVNYLRSRGWSPADVSAIVNPQPAGPTLDQPGPLSYIEPSAVHPIPVYGAGNQLSPYTPPPASAYSDPSLSIPTVPREQIFSQPVNALISGAEYLNQGPQGIFNPLEQFRSLGPGIIPTNKWEALMTAAGLASPLIGQRYLQGGSFSLPTSPALWNALKTIDWGGESGQLTIRPSEGWTSALRDLIEQKMPNRASAEQVRAIASGAPAEEVGTSNLLKLEGTLSKEDVLRNIDETQPQIQEVLRTEGDTRYGKYSTPGGENYRELLLTLPSTWRNPEPTIGNYAEFAKARGYDDAKIDATWRTADPVFLDWRQANNAAWERYQARPPEYQSSHWEEPNVLAHVRFSDRVSPDGKKTLLIDEIQSDWHQQGRKEGYTPSGEPEAAPSWTTVPGRTQGVPDAPFKKDWHELAFKRMLRWAADNGYDRVAWTTGEQQAERFDLSKQVSRLMYHPERQVLTAQNPEGYEVFRQNVPPDKVPDYIGKEAAQKLFAQPVSDEPRRPGWQGYKILEGQDLKMGGEGMKGFYDKILKDYANKQGKRYGTQVGTTQLPTSRTGARDPQKFPIEKLYRLNDLLEEEDNLGFDDQLAAKRAIADHADWKERWNVQNPELKQLGDQYHRSWRLEEPFHSLDIIPQMQEDIRQGLPLFGNPPPKKTPPKGKPTSYMFPNALLPQFSPQMTNAFA